MVGWELVASGEDWYPFAEIPQLKKLALTGVDDKDMSYMSRVDFPDYSRMPLPPSSAPADNTSVVPFGNGSKTKSSFKPVYD